MIIPPQQWHTLWEAVTDDFPQSTEKGLAVIFSLQEVETVCAVKMLLVRTCNCCFNSMSSLAAKQPLVLRHPLAPQLGTVLDQQQCQQKLADTHSSTFEVVVPTPQLLARSSPMILHKQLSST
jgi:hypothetical protein